MKRLNYIELAIVLAGFLILIAAGINYAKPVNQAFVKGCDTLKNNYSCNPVETSSIVAPNYKIEDGSFAHLVDVCARLGAAGQDNCARLCGC